MSFLDKLKGKIEEGSQGSAGPVGAQELKKDKKMQGFMQLGVDIYQNSKEIFIVAPIAGIDIKDIEINIENENDVITIKGSSYTPELCGKDEEKGSYLVQECSWGSFYRQIILPQEIDVTRVQAKMIKNILILRMPFLRLQGKGKRKVEITTDKPPVQAKPVENLAK